MRLNQLEQQIIKETIHEIMGKTAIVWLFGSRVDDNQYGGDIDLLIETDLNDPMERIQKKSLLWARLQQKLGEQRIDIVLTTKKSQPIEKIAKTTGIRL